MAAATQLAFLDDIPKMVKRIRKQLGLNTREFALRIGVHRTYVSMLESGRRTPSMAVLQRVRKLAGTSPRPSKGKKRS